MNNFLRYILWALLATLILLKEVWAFSGGFQRSLNDRPWGLSSIDHPKRAGQQAERFELRPGDCSTQPGWSDCDMDRERVEQSQRKPWIAQDTVNWYSWSLMLSPDWQDISPVTTTLGQFHHRDSGTPALLFVQRNGALWLRIESAKNLYPGRDHYFLASLEELKAGWVDIVVQARFSRTSAGIIHYQLYTTGCAISTVLSIKGLEWPFYFG